MGLFPRGLFGSAIVYFVGMTLIQTGTACKTLEHCPAVDFLGGYLVLVTAFFTLNCVFCLFRHIYEAIGLFVSLKLLEF